MIRNINDDQLQMCGQARSVYTRGPVDAGLSLNAELCARSYLCVGERQYLVCIIDTEICIRL